MLDKGRVAEYEEPYILLENKDGFFYKMVQHMGKTEAIALTKIAKEVCITVYISCINVLHIKISCSSFHTCFEINNPINSLTQLISK